MVSGSKQAIMATVPKPIVQTTIRLDPRQYEAVQEDAREEGLSVNSWIAQAIQDRLDRRRGERKGRRES